MKVQFLRICSSLEHSTKSRRAWKILKVPFLRIYSSLEHSTKSRRAWKILKVQFLRIYSSLEHSTMSWRAWKILKVPFLKIYSSLEHSTKSRRAWKQEVELPEMFGHSRTYVRRTMFTNIPFENILFENIRTLQTYARKPSKMSIVCMYREHRSPYRSLCDGQESKSTESLESNKIRQEIRK